MTDQTPATEAGRRLRWRVYDEMWTAEEADTDAIAIEAEARDSILHLNPGMAYDRGRADALREAAEAVRALWTHPDDMLDRADVLAILDPQP